MIPQCFSAFPVASLIMIGSVLSAWLKDEGLSRSAIGLFGIIFATYFLIFSGSVVGQNQAPTTRSTTRLDFRWQGQCFAVLSDVSTHCRPRFALCCINRFLVVCLSHARYRHWWFSHWSIAQDDDGMSAASSVATAGWWTGYGGLGVILFFLADMTSWTWPNIYLLLGALMALLMRYVFSEHKLTAKPCLKR